MGMARMRSEIGGRGRAKNGCGKVACNCTEMVEMLKLVISEQ